MVRKEGNDRRLTRALLVCGVVAGPLFMVALFIEGATRAHYDPIRHPGSSLELGPYGWVQQVNFVVAGLLTLAFAVGLKRALSPGRGARWGPLLVGWWAVGLVGAGLFVTDPVNGYPPGTPNAIAVSTWHGSLHDLLSVPGFVALCVAFLVLARRFAAERRTVWTVYSVATAVVFASSFGLAGAAMQQVPRLIAVGGLFQRVTAVAGWLWLTLVAGRLLRPPALLSTVASLVRPPSRLGIPPAARQPQGPVPATTRKAQADRSK
jgi:hypothetical protein